MSDYTCPSCKKDLGAATMRSVSDNIGLGSLSLNDVETLENGTAR